jgi:hypothetical protein
MEAIMAVLSAGAGASAGEQVAWRRFWWVALLTIGGAVAINLIGLLVLGAIVDLPDAGALTMGAIAMFTALFVAIGVGVFALVGRMTANVRRIYTLIAWAAMVISCVPDVMLINDPSPLVDMGMTSAAAAYLIIFHVLPLFVVLPVLTGLGLEPRRR